jgi:hypothetical protein
MQLSVSSHPLDQYGFYIFSILILTLTQRRIVSIKRLQFLRNCKRSYGSTLYNSLGIVYVGTNLYTKPLYISLRNLAPSQFWHWDIEKSQCQHWANSSPLWHHHLGLDLVLGLGTQLWIGTSSASTGCPI